MPSKPTVSRSAIGLLLGPAVFLGLYLAGPFGLSPAAKAVLASTAWIVIWWVTEAIPIPVTSLLPVVLFPTTGVMTVGSATAPYADPIVFLLLGGFLIALAIERWNLHHRLSLLIISTVGTSGKGLVFGFMGATAFLSMWISNTATAMMMVPIGAAVIVELTAIGGRKTPPLDRDELEEPNDPLDVEGELLHGFESDAVELPNTSFGLAVMLGIAYGASIGGAATLIGSPPNAVLTGVAESSLGVEIGFLDWMLVGVPIAVIFLLITWVLLVVVLRPTIDRQPGRTDVIDDQLRELGAMTTGERRVLAVFGLVAACWIVRPFVLQPVVPMLTDAMIAVGGAVLVFLIPVDGERMLDWEYTARVPWGVLLLLGAGFSLARGFQESGLDSVVADAIAGLGVTELAGMILLIATVVILLTNVTSNTATASLFMPIAVSIGAAIGVTPLTLMATAAFAASFAFMLPVATAPNAIVFGSGYLTIPQMAKIGFIITLPAILVISAFAIWWIPIVWA
ncbi:DASS family sodium-coupled anion symporter [Halorubrum sp. CBA1125]|uniref:SLC13 family permease n=1 Tax=Halorubrum sp. CBA1125 TaxID=2668072 RepID=UPI0012E7DDA0|nr:DASS family sodium-coupled anion symporter [Halorubrum sp. CBA1125]MUW14056.1 DASS family sodium-coupled anion symporter [Halorubrum sp. CBA1125]